MDMTRQGAQTVKAKVSENTAAKAQPLVEEPDPQKETV